MQLGWVCLPISTDICIVFLTVTRATRLKLPCQGLPQIAGMKLREITSHLTSRCKRWMHSEVSIEKRLLCKGVNIVASVQTCMQSSVINAHIYLQFCCSSSILNVLNVTIQTHLVSCIHPDYALDVERLELLSVVRVLLLRTRCSGSDQLFVAPANFFVCATKWTDQ